MSRPRNYFQARLTTIGGTFFAAALAVTGAIVPTVEPGSASGANTAEKEDMMEATWSANNNGPYGPDNLPPWLPPEPPAEEVKVTNVSVMQLEREAPGIILNKPDDEILPVFRHHRTAAYVASLDAFVRGDYSSFSTCVLTPHLSAIVAQRPQAGSRSSDVEPSQSVAPRESVDGVPQGNNEPSTNPGPSSTQGLEDLGFAVDMYLEEAGLPGYVHLRVREGLVELVVPSERTAEYDLVLECPLPIRLVAHDSLSRINAAVKLLNDGFGITPGYGGPGSDLATSPVRLNARATHGVVELVVRPGHRFSVRQVKALRSVSADYPGIVSVIERDLTNRKRRCRVEDGDRRCEAPVRAGIWLRNSQSTPEGECTVGPVVRHYNDTAYLTTSGHCFATEGGWWYGAFGTAWKIGSTRENYFNPFNHPYIIDLQTISLDGGEFSPMRAYLGSFSGTEGVNYNFTGSQQLNYPNVGTPICYAGSVSGFQCAEVTAKGFDDYVEAQDLYLQFGWASGYRLERLTETNHTTVQNGDSGAPVLLPNGVMVGVLSQAADFGRMYFAPFASATDSDFDNDEVAPEWSSAWQASCMVPASASGRQYDYRHYLEVEHFTSHFGIKPYPSYNHWYRRGLPGAGLSTTKYAIQYAAVRLARLPGSFGLRQLYDSGTNTLYPPTPSLNQSGYNVTGHLESIRNGVGCTTDGPYGTGVLQLQRNSVF